jgi:hypothetical protein
MKVAVQAKDSRNVRMTPPLPCAGRVRQWLGTVPAARVWAVRHRLPLTSYDGAQGLRVQETEVVDRARQ